MGIIDLKAPFGGYNVSGNRREWGGRCIEETFISKLSLATIRAHPRMY
ncbi:hypothetical protein J7E52_15275 [Bacillus sp. ISL-34]|nr:hypothetical protein [Bacillus sp. ISL-34]MBT2648035.1 hypothetical protein [Bacillus sp. ISL-34]